MARPKSKSARGKNARARRLRKAPCRTPAYRTPGKPRRFSRFILGVILLAGFALVGLIFFNPLVWRLNLRSALEQSKLASTVYDRNGGEVATLYSKTRLWAPIREIPAALQHAFVATEDSRFYIHKGIDFRGIARALYQDIRMRSKAQGGSTITQQLVKNLFFTQEKSFLRKIWEMAYAVRIEQQYSKERILEFYLNSIYLGHEAWGVEAAAEVYFGKNVSELDISECAMIAGLARSPEYYSPFRNPRDTVERRNLVLQLMRRQGYLNAAQQARYTKQPLRILQNPGSTFVGAYFVDYVINVLKKETDLSESQIRSSGLKIYTTMDQRIQGDAENALQLLPVQGPDRWGVPQPQGAILALDPQNGEILAVVGGKRYSAAQPNRAYQIYRQPGSAIKPFLYAAALEAGYTPESKFVDQPLVINVNGNPWRPQNYDNKFRGDITLRVALEESVNTVAIQLVQQLTAQKVFSYAKHMGLESLVGSGDYNDVGLAPLALGGLTKGVTLLEISGAFSSFANQGIYSRPFGLVKVVDHQGRLIYQGRTIQEKVIQTGTAETLTEMMEGVITRGTGIQANVGVRAAGKTGTSNQNTNGWFIGYTADLLAGIWIGNDQASQPLLVKGVPLGSGMAAAIWGNLIRRTTAKTAALPPRMLLR